MNRKDAQVVFHEAARAAAKPNQSPTITYEKPSFDYFTAPDRPDLRHGLRQFTGPCGGIRSQEAAITKTAEAFVEAFQKGDAKAVSFRRSTE